MAWFDQFKHEYTGRKDYDLPPESRVYCMTEGSGLPVKLGSTQQLANRMAQFQAHTWRKVYLCWDAPAGIIHETALKRILRNEVLHGEWIHDANDRLKLALPQFATLDELLALIDQMAVEYKTPTATLETRPRKGQAVIHPFARAV